MGNEKTKEIRVFKYLKYCEIRYDDRLVIDVMKRIKGFRIDLSTKKILEILKSKNLLTPHDFTEPNQDLVKFYKIRDIHLVKKEKKEQIEKAINRSYSLIVPSMVYRTLNKEKIEKLSIKIEDLTELTKDWLAASFWVVTIGEKLEKEMKMQKLERDLSLACILDSIGWEALKEASNFAWRLIAIEAKKQECVLTSRLDNYCENWNDSINEKILQILEGEKVGVTLKENYTLSPQKSMLAFVGWVSPYRSHRK